MKLKYQDEIYVTYIYTTVLSSSWIWLPFPTVWYSSIANVLPFVSLCLRYFSQSVMADTQTHYNLKNNTVFVSRISFRWEFSCLEFKYSVCW